jgi:hypothetical protein
MRLRTCEECAWLLPDLNQLCFRQIETAVFSHHSLIGASLDTSSYITPCEKRGHTHIMMTAFMS